MSLIAALLLAGAQPALAKAGDCGWVHGRYAIANGSRVHRIWMIGTNHELNLDVADEAPGEPRPLKHILATPGYEPWSDRLFGDFYVCARERRIRGHMQTVHLIRARNLRIAKSPRR